MTTALQTKLLRPAMRLLEVGSRSLGGLIGHDVRWRALEAVAAQLGGFDLEWYWNATGVGGLPAEEAVAVRELAVGIVQELSESPVPIPLAVCALAAPELGQTARRQNGVYYTDWRLAQFLAGRVSGRLARPGAWIDPACGSGVLLVALVLAAEQAGLPREDALRRCVFGADKSAAGVRGARLALSSLTSDHETIATLLGHLRERDSLLAGLDGWEDVAPRGFDVVVGNPPWEKLKLTRHEFMKAQGIRRHYGAEYGKIPYDELKKRKQELASYLERLYGALELQGSGEADLYKCFIELAFRVARPGGEIGYLVPAGLIRSKGTLDLRESLLRRSRRVDCTLLDNRARFFAIDTRTKFLAIHAELGGGCDEVEILHGVGTDDKVEIASSATLSVDAVRTQRPDLTFPEVRTNREWRLFSHAFETGDFLDGRKDSPWRMSIVREVDMTSNKNLFERDQSERALPVAEGRMVQQFHFGAKAYRSGTGRRAVWEPAPPTGAASLRPQYWLPEERLPRRVRQRVRQDRVGFCDVTGQTNERSFLAAMIPSGVACGNKVPTVTLEGLNGNAQLLSWTWLGVANSFAFDWLLRRVITTTVNFFMLRGMVFPRMGVGGETALRIAELAQRAAGPLPTLSIEGLWRRAEVRAELDALICAAYGFGPEETETLLADFPLLDRWQPALEGEDESTVTKDLVRLYCRRAVGAREDDLADRVSRARTAGAIPFVPSEFVRHYRGGLRTQGRGATNGK